jgi:hypothetical protein
MTAPTAVADRSLHPGADAPRSPKTARRLIVLEFNELCPALLTQFMAEGKLPHFRRLYESSTVYTTDAGEQASHLEPWIQWPTVHSGQPYAGHGCFHLGDGRKMTAKCLAELLSDAGVPVGVCGSMNTNYGPLNGYVLPDPWDKHSGAWPADLADYADAVGRLVRESSRSGMSKRDLARVGWFLVRNGLSFGAVRDAVAQLLDELRDRGVSWRRACVLDRLQYDVFRRLNARHRVRFATFFCNSTAHFQHYYWRHMDPGQFDVPPPAEDHRSLAGAIVHGYRAMDRLVGMVLRDYRDARILLCTALSQQPWTDATKCTWRPKDFGALFAFAGCPVNGSAAEPVMAEQFHVRCGGPQLAHTTEVLLRDLTLDGGEPVLELKRQGDKLFAGCRLTAPDLAGRTVVRKSTGATASFGELFYRIHTMRSGRHHPDGVLWDRTGEHRVVAEKVPLTAIAPTVLAHFGVTPPATMATQRLSEDVRVSA